MSGPASDASVSVVVPAWNAASHIGEALNSAFCQTYGPAEVIVVNDGSPDTPALVDALRPFRDRPGFRYIVQENGGPSAARNAGVRAASGEFVAFLDADDSWDPGYLGAQVRRLTGGAGLDLVYCDARLTGDSPPAGRTYMETAPSRGAVTVDSLISLDCNIPTSCTVARRRTVVDAGLFDPAIRRCEDFDLWVRMALNGARMDYHRQVLVTRRIHDGSAVADVVAMFRSQLEVYAKCVGVLGAGHPSLPLLHEQIRRARADLALAEGKRQLLAREYRRAARSLAVARAYYQSAKLTCAWLGLYAAPALVRRWLEARPISR